MEEKRRKRKTVPALVFLILTFVMTACGKQTDRGTGHEPETEQPASRAEEADGKQERDKESGAAQTDRYEPILDQYRDMVRNDFYTGLRDPDTYESTDAYESSFGEDIHLEIRTHKQDLFYALYDIDGNGTQELIIAGGENAVPAPVFSPWNYDLYGIDGTDTVHIFPEMDFGYRTNFSLYENGVIEVFYSGSAAESGVDFYKIGNDGITPGLVASFTAVGHLEGEEAVFTYTRDGKEITEEEYHDGIQSYEVPLTAELEWIQIQ